MWIEKSIYTIISNTGQQQLVTKSRADIWALFIIYNPNNVHISLIEPIDSTKKNYFDGRA